MSLLSLLDKTCLIERNTPATDSIAGITANWTTRLSSVPCALWPASARVVEIFGTLDSVAQFELCTATDIGCTTQDRITINGKIYYVIGYMPYGDSSVGPETPFVTVLGKRNQP